MRQLLWLLALAVLIVSCRTKSSSTEQTTAKTDSSVVTTAPESTETDQAAATNDFLIVAGERVGPIKAMTSEADLLKLLGASIVTAGDTMYGPEGDTYLGTTLYKGTADETQIIYTDSTRMRPESVAIRPRFSDSEGNPIQNRAKMRWRTADDLHIGTTLKELEQRNGKPFKLYGFAWDYGGTLSDWQGGKLSKLTKTSPIALVLGPPVSMTAKQEKAYNAVMGDGEFLSSDANMQTLNPIVVSISVGLSR